MCFQLQEVAERSNPLPVALTNDKAPPSPPPLLASRGPSYPVTRFFVLLTPVSPVVDIHPSANFS